jgi:transposase
MSLGRQRREKQEPIWIEAASLALPGGHPFYDRLSALLYQGGFDIFAGSACERFYSKTGRPGLAPGVYFRLLLVGYFEGIDSERGIAWRAADSLTLRRFFGFSLEEGTPDHTTISRTRRLIDLETHRDIFGWVLKTLAEKGLLKGSTISIDGTTLEANAALRSIVHRATGEAYNEFLSRLAAESGIETPTREQLAKLDRKRARKGSNEEWESPQDPDSRIVKMKDGRTHLAHKAEHAVDLETGAVVAVVLHRATAGDTQTVAETLCEAGENICGAAAAAPAAKVSPVGPQEVVLDKGYHSNDALKMLKQWNVRAYCSEPDRGRRNWKDKEEEREAVYGNRRRVRGERGKWLLRQRGEKVERAFAHMYETGAMRRTHLRRHSNILKRLLIHAAAFNLGLLMRDLTGSGTPRQMKERAASLCLSLTLLLRLNPNEVPACEQGCRYLAVTRASRVTP